MPVNDDLGKRMKEFYEKPAQTKLIRRMPVAIRIDGKAFHTFTRGFQKPFDNVLMKTMQETTKYLCENIQGCVFGFTQSDEITLILVDYKELNSSAWFDYEVQKLCSISASMATMAFNKFFAEEITGYEYDIAYDIETTGKPDPEMIKMSEVYHKAANKGAMFDARCFNVPKEEVTNYFYWRQLDAIRNSINGCAQSKYSSKKLQGLNIREVLAKMESDGFNWNDLPIYKQRGTAVVKDVKGEWLVDKEMPALKDSDRFYVDRLLGVNDK